MKTKLIIFLLFVASIGYSQRTTMVTSASSATVTANFDITPTNGTIGSLQTITSSNFAGTTGTIALQGSNDGTNFTRVYANDGVTALSQTLIAASTSYVWELQRVLYQTYRIVYTKGNASAGSITIILTQR